jgi:CRISPR-associated protein Cas6/Cse3/CasE subtype I-E
LANLPTYERIFWFDGQVRGNKFPNASTLAHHFELSPKTTQRTIEFLRDRMAAPLEYDASKKGYFYSENTFELPHIQTTQEEILAIRDWLISKGENRRHDKDLHISGGFRILQGHPLEISPMQANYFRKHEHRAYHGGVQFRGSLEVTDREMFLQTYQSGIGSAKSFGFGLMLLTPIKL